MSGYELWKELSEIDDDLIVEPVKFVSLRLNLLFCIISANVSRFIPRSKPILSLAVDLLAFAIMYAGAMWMINRNRKKKIIGEENRHS